MHIDPRSLAFFRIGLGALVLAQVIQLGPDCDAFFVQLATSTCPAGPWIHFLLPLFAVLLLAGFCTRLSTLLCWLGIVIVQQANTHILIGGDVFLRLLLFWSLFLPLGETWSVDARLFKKTGPVLPLASRVAAWAITLQICLVYWSAWALKTDPLWTKNGNALFFALNITDLTSPFGLYMSQFHGLLRVLTFSTLYLELLGPFLLFIPFYRDRFRLLAVILFFTFHLIGMQSLLAIGLFPWVCAVAWTIFLPGFFWDFVMRPAREPALAPTPSPKARAFDWCVAGFIGLCLADVLAWNAISLRTPEDWQWMKRHDVSQNIVHLNQKWGMYAPYPQNENGWLAVPADLADGTQADLFTGEPLSWNGPANIRHYLGDIQWRSYIYEVVSRHDTKLFEQYSSYLVNRWNQGHPESRRVKKLSIVYVKTRTNADLTVTRPEQVTLYTRNF